MSQIEQLRGLIRETSDHFGDIGGQLDMGTEHVTAANQGFSAHEEIKNESRDLCIEIGGDIRELSAKLGRLVSLLGEGAALDTDIGNRLDAGLQCYRAAQEEIPVAVTLLRAVFGATADGGQRSSQEPGVVETRMKQAFNSSKRTQNGIDQACRRTQRMEERSKTAAGNFATQCTAIDGLAQQLQGMGERVEKVRSAIYDIDQRPGERTLLAEDGLYITTFMSREPGVQGPVKQNDLTLDELEYVLDRL